MLHQIQHDEQAVLHCQWNWFTTSHLIRHYYMKRQKTIIYYKFHIQHNKSWTADNKLLHELKFEKWFKSSFNLYSIQSWQTITNDEILSQLKKNKYWKHCNKSSAFAAIQKLVFNNKCWKLHKLFVKIHQSVNWEHNIVIQIDFEIQLQMMNFWNLKCSASNSSCLSSINFCWENSCSKSSQEKDYSQSQDSSVSQEHAWNCNKKTEHIKTNMLS